jgi:hypothetical protein
VETKNQTKKKICLLFVVVAKELGVDNEQAAVALEQSMATKNYTVEEICLQFVVVAK